MADLPPGKIPDLGNPPKAPDKYTKRSPDMTGGEAANRVLFINLPFFKYGTDDKTHAGSIFLSLLLLVLMAVIALVGMFSPQPDSFKMALSVFGSAFSFVAGVAIGRGNTSGKKRKLPSSKHEDELD